MPNQTPQCPTCVDGYGRPVAVAMSSTQQTVRYACDTCGHQWVVIRPWGNAPVGADRASPDSAAS